MWNSQKIIHKKMLRKSDYYTGFMIMLCSGNIFAQESAFPLSRPADERPDVLEQQPFKPKTQPQLSLPPVKPPEPSDKQISQVLKFKLEALNFSGNTVFSGEQLQALIASYIGNEIDTLDIQQIKNLITKHYIDNGYLNSGAIIPDQDIQDGALDIQIVEGELSDVRVANKGRLRNQYISDRIRLDPHKPLNLYVLQERLFMLQQDPRIKRINADLGPGEKRGESILNIEITEERPYTILLQADNHQPPSIGEEQGTLRFQHFNITGFGDKIDATVNYTEGLNKGYVNYQWPLTADDKILYAAYEKSDSIIVTDEIKAIGLDLENKSDTATIGLTYPVYKASSETFDVTLQLDKRKSTSYIDGTAVSYAGSGAVDGVSKITALRLIQNWLKFSPQTVYSFRHIMSVGLDALDSTQHDGLEPDSDFFAWLLQGQVAKQYASLGLQTVFRADLQVAFDDLMSMEQIAAGGANSVRGYRENQLVRDNGFIASMELRKAIFQSEDAQHLVQVAGFADYGRAWMHSGPVEPESIYSVGAGLRWQWNRTALAEFYWAEPLKDISNPDDDSLQDDGIHLKLVAYFP
ncbi:MAG: BamA/TamA family outer membrane protein [Gammaproteobacteria bacterium]|nr:BamA/TamA family outer membrane protein [Gammaproteobacteria bacterium]